jgi:hypothetical protein
VTDKTCSCRFTASGAAFNSAPIWASSIVIGFTAVLLHAAPIISQGGGRGEWEKCIASLAEALSRRRLACRH